MSSSDPLAPVVRPWLDAYRAASSRIRIEWTDPEREPARFLALEARLGITPGAAKDGKSLSDAVIVLEHGNRKKYVTIDDLLRFDPASGDAEPRIEQAITEAIRGLSDTLRPVICFTQGHRELSVDDAAPTGLSELKSLLQKEAIDTRTIALESGEQEKLLQCTLLVIAEPEIAFSPWEKSQVDGYRSHIGSLWIMSGTVPDESGRVRGTGLNALLPDMGISLDDNVIIEEDERYRLPEGFGESFFAGAAEHPITHSLRRGSASDSLHVLVSLAPSIDIKPGAPLQTLLQTSMSAYAVHDVSPYVSGSPPNPPADEPRQVFTLAIASDLGVTSSGAKRRVVICPASVATNHALRQPTLLGNRAFVDGVVSWLVARSADVEGTALVKATPELALTAAEVKKINRYVLLVMPGAALLTALTVFAARNRRIRRH